MTSPCWPGTLAGGVSSACGDARSPDTYATRRVGSMTIPPESPGITSFWITLPRLGPLIATMRMSLMPRPADSVHR